jgi:hypothetical protein
MSYALQNIAWIAMPYNSFGDYRRRIGSAI